MALTTSIPGLFPGSFAGGRARFRAAAATAGATLASHPNPEKGPDGEALSTESAWLGPKDASRLLLAMAGTHGAEGFCGSGIETGWLESGIFTPLPADTAVLLIHAINPYGFAWVRRVNENNIDLNRNFVDHAKPRPDNPGYRALRDAICPEIWSVESEARNRDRFLAYADAHGRMALQAAITQGQYFDDEGVFYGGTAPSWSNRTLRAILAPHASHVKKVAFIDLHTGLGPYGYGEIISNHLSGDPGNARVKDWFGSEATSTDGGSSTSAVISGDTHIGLAESLPGAEATGITLEYGTVPLEDMLNAVRADNWVHVHGDLASAKGREIKSEFRATFYPDKDDWKKLVFDRAVDVLERTMRGLTQS
ncbi:MAG TPA: M14 family metallopeptidase [Candidatus Cybelea sp.]|nr:M14 family metallopeptidase [Candidatus Cybelea sp.]